jgi:quercetin dioxygenase-like cupin family protein
MAPGATLVAHRHADVEESYVIEGDLLVAGELMHAGDYCRAEPGSVHAGVSTIHGCVFIAVQSQRDELDHFVMRNVEFGMRN